MGLRRVAGVELGTTRQTRVTASLRFVRGLEVLVLGDDGKTVLNRDRGDHESADPGASASRQPRGAEQRETGRLSGDILDGRSLADRFARSARARRNRGRRAPQLGPRRREL